MTNGKIQTLGFDNGDQMPVLGLGTWKSTPGEVSQAIKDAVRMGYRHIDCAFIYENEAEIGQALAELFEEGQVRREDLWITSKLWNDSHATEDVEAACAKTLADLKLDYLDLYLIHWPVVSKKGVFIPRSADDQISLEDLPIRDTWKGMEALVDKGMCRHIGVSNFSAPKLKQLLSDARIGPEVNQIELHPYLQQSKMLDFCSSHNVHLTAYSPLGSPDRPAGLKAADEVPILQDTAIATIANKHNCSPAQVLINWAIARGTSVIPKSVNPERMSQNLAAVDITLDDDDLHQIAELERGRRYVTGSFWAMPGGPFTLTNLWDE